MVGNTTLGAVVVVSLWSSAALAQAPADSVSPTPEAPPPAATAPEAPPPPPSEVPAAPTKESTPDLEAPAPQATPRVTWKSDADTTQNAPEGEAAEEEGEDEASPPLSPDATTWQLGGAHFVLSLERLTTLLSWKRTTTLPNSGINGPSSGTTDVSSSGTDVSFLFGGGERTPSSMPRIAFDGIFSGGFTIGGSVGLMSSSGKNEGNAFRTESNQADISGGLFGVRAGYFVQAGSVGIWLRGGFTYLSASVDGEVPTGTDFPPTVSTKATVSAWAFTLDPQLVLIAAPRIGITLGPLLDIPLAGTDKAESQARTVEYEYRNGAYGLTAGVAAIF